MFNLFGASVKYVDVIVGVLIFSLVCVFALFDVRDSFFVSFMALMLASFYLVKYRKNLYLSITLVFVIAYPFIYIVSQYLGVPYHYLHQYQENGYEYILFTSMLVFIFIFFFSVKKNVSFYLPEYELKLISTFFIILAVLIMLVGLASVWPPVTTGYGVESRSSQLFEYALIFLALGVVLKRPAFNKKDRIHSFLFFSAIAVCIIVPLLFGRRGPAMMYFWLALLVVSFNFEAKTMKIIFVLGVMVIMRLYALDRADTPFSIEALVMGSANNGSMSNHQGGVIVSSVTYIGLVEEGIWDWGVRLKMAAGALVAFLPYSVHPFPEVFVHKYVNDFATIPGSGGFPFVYAFLWGGWSLVILIALGGRFLIWNKSSLISLNLCKVLVLAMFPRWYAYTLPVLLKFLFLAFIIGCLFDLLLSIKKRAA